MTIRRGGWPSDSRGSVLLLVWAVLTGCSAGSPTLSAIQNQSLWHGRLCTDVIALPDTVREDDARKNFEDALVSLGIFQRVGRTVRDHSVLFTYNVNPKHRDVLRYLRDVPSAGYVCYGSIEPTAVVATHNAGYGGVSIVSFRYKIMFDQWAQPFQTRIPVKLSGTAMAPVSATDDRRIPVWAGPVTGINAKAIHWPFNGRNWYTHGYPSILRHRKFTA